MPLPLPRRGPARVESLWALGGFAVLTVGLATLVEIQCPHWLDREYQVRRAALTDRVRENPDRPVLMTIGSSRTATGFMPERVGFLRDPAGQDVLLFNYAHLGAGPRLNLIQARRALRDGVRPTWLILEFNPTLLVQDYLPSRQATLGDVRVLSAYRPNRPRLLYQAATTRATIVHRVRTPILEWAAPAFVTRPQGVDEPNILPLGGASNWARSDYPTLEYTKKYTHMAAATHQRLMHNYRPSAHLVAATRDLLALCRAEKIQVVLLLLPEDSQFLSWYGGGAEETIQNVLNELRVDFGVAVIDARRWIPDTGFSDPHHLNLEGAQRFTDRLAAEVLAPLVTGGSSPTTPVDE